MDDSPNPPAARPAGSTCTWADRWDHVLARCGVDRAGHRVPPGLYTLGQPGPDSPVFVTANYTLSFDALRGALPGIDAYLLVLDTQGINVWCAAGKGSFGTDELVLQVQDARLREVVRHRVLILPQLGAPGVAAHEVKRRCGFGIEYGPVRATDLPAYLLTHRATAEMRQVRFDLRDRLVLIPVEIVHIVVPLLVAAALLYFVSGAVTAAAAVAAVLAGVVVFPIVLPWLPTRDFSSKGFLLGIVVALPFALTVRARHPDAAAWQWASDAMGYLLAMPPVTAFLALNFTGSTTFTSRTGVRGEINRYIPIMAGTFVLGIVLIGALAVVRWLGVGA